MFLLHTRIKQLIYYETLFMLTKELNLNGLLKVLV